MYIYGSKRYLVPYTYVRKSLASDEWFTKQRPFNLQYCVLYLPKAL